MPSNCREQPDIKSGVPATFLEEPLPRKETDCPPFRSEEQKILSIILGNKIFDVLTYPVDGEICSFSLK